MITLTPWLEAELERRAAAEAPEECCGLIGSKDGKIGCWAAENAAEDPLHSFMIGPATQFYLLREMKRRGEELAGVYHSHPHSGPEPSQRDREVAAVLSAFAADLTWVIIGFRPCEKCEGIGALSFSLGPSTLHGTDATLSSENCPHCGGEGHTGAEFWAGTLP